MSNKNQGFDFGAIPIWIMGAIAGLIGVTVVLAMRALVFWLRTPLVRLLRLEKLAAWWPVLHYPGRLLQWVAGGMFLLSLVILTKPFFTPLHTAKQIQDVVLSVFLLPLAAIVFNIVYWLQALYEDPAWKARQAGRQAERVVQRLLDQRQYNFPDARTLHGALFVFNAGTDNEYSVEADHLLITHKFIFLIETKYKSATITVDEEAAEWSFSSAHGSGSMRNALAQARNSVSVLKKQLQIEERIIPLVAIVGEHAALSQETSHVMLAQRLLLMIQAYEMQVEEHHFAPEQILAQLQVWQRDDRASIEKHIARANQKRLQRLQQDLAAPVPAFPSLSGD